MHTGLFFGSFNPIHVGHMVLANYMLEFTDLDEVWFVVSPHNPLKDKKTLLGQNHRLAMVRLAVEDHDRLKASNIEFKLPQPSYTINTLAHLKEKYPKKEFSLIMGMDNLQTFHKWKNYEQILKNHKLYVYPRPRLEAGKFADHPQVILTDAPQMDISSSFIRKAIKEKKNVDCFMPEKVAVYINEMNFYKK
ncbi:MAG: nicotinate (nicotinamide) nucleotide adenylyltransferase [Bacteroidia bacterium]